MRRTLISLALPLVSATSLLAQEGHAAAEGGSIMDPKAGLVVWTLLIFVILLIVLSKVAYKPLLAAVEAREAALEKALGDAKRDRDAAALLLAEQQKALAEARAEMQKAMNDGRAAAESLRSEMLEKVKAEGADMLDRTRREMQAEKEKAVADLRREAIDLAISGASKVIGRNLDSATDRSLVESFLAGLETPKGTR
ncbi:MAG TPA: F0F1 ATP synthase subunit B [Gemmatimonadaceae bacterium]|nr:F0F1 ATP synthase subunit B [Gemmatimonadaceae bacterium]